MGTQGLTARALQRGLQVITRLPADVLKVWAISVALSVPLALAMRAALERSIGSSEVGERLVAGWDGLWFRGFEAQATGLSTSFGPGVVGIGAVFKGLDAMVTATLGNLAAPVLAAAAIYALLWVLLSGGLIARYARPDDPPGLLSAGAASFARLLPLWLIALAAHAAVFVGVLPYLAGVVGWATVDVIDERIAFVWTLGKYGVVWLLITGIGIVHDYAKIALVLEPKRSIGQAIGRAFRFVGRSPGPVLGVTLAALAAFVAVVAIYWVIAPGVAQPNPFMILIALLIGQASIAARIALRCWGHAVRVSLVQDADGVAL